MDERIFSAFIKYLDLEHQQILDEITKKRQELEQLQREYYGYDNSIRDSLARQLYALESSPQKDNEAIERIRKELNSLPSREELEIEIGKLKQEIEELQNKFVSLPFEVPLSTLTPLINFKVDIDGKFLVMGNDGKYYVKEDPFGTALGNYRVETDPNTHLPTRIIWVKQDSDTYGMPLKFERQLKITSPVFEIIKPIKKEREVVEYVDKPIKIEKIIPSLTCPRCSWNLTDKMRLINCPNCGLSLFDAVKLAVEKELGNSSLKENKKDKKRWIF
jgi:hypothetical protein